MFILVKFIEDYIVRNYLVENGVIWVFNLFYVFYMGGVWECLIGVVWRIFDVMFLCNYGNFIYEIFFIFMVEVIVIVNVRFLIIIFYDFELFCLLIFFLLLIKKFLLVIFLILDFGWKDMLRS